MRKYFNGSRYSISQSGVGCALCAVLLLAIFCWFEVLRISHPIEQQHMSVGNSERPNANLGKKTATSDVFQEFADLDAGGGGGDDGWRTRPFR